MHIAVAGNIGSGKTTLTGLLAKHYGWEPHFESVDFNPYLVDFYNDMQRWSFNLQVYFLNKRLKDIVEFQNSGKNVIQDRTIYEDAMIFAPNLHDMGLMDSRDFDNYTSLFELMQKMVGYPDLLVYLTCARRFRTSWSRSRSAAASTRTASASTTSRASTTATSSGYRNTRASC